MSEPSQPESTERCAICDREKATWKMDATALAGACCATLNDPPFSGDEMRCYRLGYEIKVRALAEAETLKRISDSQAHEAWIERDGALARLAEAEKERDEVRADYNVRRMAVDIEREQRIAAFDKLERMSEALTECGYTDEQARIAAIAILDEPAGSIPENALRLEADALGSQLLGVQQDCIAAVKRARAAEERAAQAERALRLIAMPKYGLQGLMEEAAPESELADYWKGLAQGYEAQARAALQEAAKGRAPEAPPDPNDLAGITDVIRGGAQGEEK